MWVCVPARGQKRVLRSPVLELQALVIQATWLLGTKFRYSARTAVLSTSELLPQLVKMGLDIHICGLSTWKAKTEGWEVQGQPQIHIEFQTGLGYIKSCLKKQGGNISGERGWWLRAYTTIVGDLSSSLSSHVKMLTTAYNSGSKGSDTIFRLPQTLALTCTDTQANTHAHTQRDTQVNTHTRK